MSEPLYILAQNVRLNATDYQINFSFANEEVFNGPYGYPGYQPGYTLGTLDEPNNVFPDFETAANYFYGVNATTMLDNLNMSYGGTPYYLGGLFFFLEDLEVALTGKQPLAGTLTELSEVDVSDHIKDMMETATKADARLHLELDTMALQDEADYYTKTAVDAIAAGKASASHTHVINDISNASTIGKAILGASGAGAVRSAIISTGTHINDAPVDAPTNAETNAPTDAPTNLNVVTTLLGALTGEVNATNARQNTIAAKVNANATKQNSIATKVNDGFTKLNAVFDALETNALLAA